MTTETVELTWSFDELDLEGAYEQLSDEIDEVLAIQTYLADHFCSLPFEKQNSDLGVFLRTEIERFSSEFRRLLSIQDSLTKIKRWKN